MTIDPSDMERGILSVANDAHFLNITSEREDRGIFCYARRDLNISLVQ
jgi:hypothetical protein